MNEEILQLQNKVKNLETMLEDLNYKVWGKLGRGSKRGVKT